MTQNADFVARLFHDTYERLALEFGYETRRDSAVPWDEVPETNRRLMVATVAAVLAQIDGGPDRCDHCVNGNCYRCAAGDRCACIHPGLAEVTP